jgi:hypothetical protein
MLSSARRAAIFAAAGLCLSAGSAPAQQVFACYTLHNDLANFDRRARQVDHYFPGWGWNHKEIYARSHIGAADVVRLRIIGEMRRLGCPLSQEAFVPETEDGTVAGNNGPRRVITLPLK